MVKLDIPRPEHCEECPCSYWVKTGEYEGRLMCEAMEYRDIFGMKEPVCDYESYMLEEGAKAPPESCPMTDVM